MYKYFMVVLSFIMVACMGCAEDKKVGLSSDANQIEKDYFEDYESPKHKWGFIDERGMVTIEPSYDDVGDMIGPLTTANANGKWGYINMDGVFQIPAIYKQAYEFVDSKAIVQTFDNVWQIIDNKGALISELNHESINQPNHGVATFKNGEYMGLIDSVGKVLLEAKYKNILPVDPNTWIVKEGSIYSIINAQGEKLSSEYDRIYRPYNDRYRVKLNKKYGYLNAADYTVIGQIEYDKASDFKSKNTVVFKNNQYSLVSKELTEIMNLPYDKIEYIEEDMWKYKQNGKWGLVTSDGQAVSSAKFDLLNRFSDGLVAFSIDELWGYANKIGLKSIPAKYKLVWDFHDGRARVIDNRGVGFIDKKGDMVVNDIFFEVRDFHQGKARFQTY